MPLTQAQIDFFHVNGYVAVGQLLKDDELPALRDEYDRIFREAAQDGRYRNLAIDDTEDLAKKKSAPRQMLQVMQVCERSLVFRRLIGDDRILDIAEDLIGSNIMLFHDQALSKPAHTGGPIVWHQDNAYWKCKPANLVSCWLTLDPVVRENGAMQLIPGSHLTPVAHARAAVSNALIETPVDESRAVVVDLPAGGAMFHHCQTLHHTAPNTTPNQRRAFAIHFMNPGTRNGNGEVMHPNFGRPVLRLSI